MLVPAGSPAQLDNPGGTWQRYQQNSGGSREQQRDAQRQVAANTEELKRDAMAVLQDKDQQDHQHQRK